MLSYEGMTAVLYARVSTDDKGQSTDAQIREMKTWCELHGVEILAIYEDEKSGATMDRPEWDRLIGRLTRGGVNILLAWSESRISRNTEDMVRIQQLLKTFGVVLRYVSAATTPETGEGALINHISTWQAQQERQKLSINTAIGMENKARQGYHMGRPLIIALTEEKDRDKARINENTKLVTRKGIMAYADRGWSAPKTAEAFGVSVTTFKKFLTREGLIKEFYDRQKGVSKERVENINTGAGKHDQ